MTLLEIVFYTQEGYKQCLEEVHNGSSAIIGASRPEQIRENVQAIDIQLSEDLLQRIDGILEGVVSY